VDLTLAGLASLALHQSRALERLLVARATLQVRATELARRGLRVLSAISLTRAGEATDALTDSIGGERRWVRDGDDVVAGQRIVNLVVARGGGCIGGGKAEGEESELLHGNSIGLSARLRIPYTTEFAKTATVSGG